MGRGCGKGANKEENMSSDLVAEVEAGKKKHGVAGVETMECDVES
jgi:hypothetical protein